MAEGIRATKNALLEIGFGTVNKLVEEVVEELNQKKKEAELENQRKRQHKNGEEKISKRKKMMFSDEQLTYLRQWLFRNIHKPYPNDEEKQELAEKTGLTFSQICIWFINARRRIVPLGREALELQAKKQLADMAMENKMDLM